MKIFWTDASGSTQEIEFDASVSEDHKASAELTKHPLESGGSVTDHVIPGPLTLSVEARVSNTPIRQPSTQMRGVTSSVAAMDLGRFKSRTLRKGATAKTNAEWDEGARNVGATVLQFSGPFDRVGDIHKLLLELRRTGQVVTAVTTLLQYENMCITELSAPRNAENGNAVTFTIGFEQATFADSQTVDVPAPSQPRGHGGANRGHQDTDDSQDEAGSRSLLAQARDAIFGREDN